MLKNLDLRKSIAIIILLAFLGQGLGLPKVQAQDMQLPVPGVRISLSPSLDPPVLKGIKVHLDDPFRFDFILDKGDSGIADDKLKDESTKLIKYFLASITVPEKDLWVNLSPYEKDRIIPKSFGLTQMGRDLLVEDYMLKQITASLIYPEEEVGKKFWKRIYEEAAKKYGTTNIPVNTFNKVWIIPEKAVVYENAKAGTAYVVESKLKVMLEEDYLSMEKHTAHDSVSLRPIGPLWGGAEGDEAILTKATNPKKIASPPAGARNDTNSLGSQIVREIVLPELTTEINQGKNFAQLRQVYNSLILATWYKKKIKDSILAQVYADRNKVAGVSINDVGAGSKPALERAPTRGAPTEILDTNAIYQRYLKAFKKGVYNYIKEEQDPLTQEVIPRKYFSGGEVLFGVGSILKANPAMPTQLNHGDLAVVAVQVQQVLSEQILKPVNQAMISDVNELQYVSFDNTGEYIRVKEDREAESLVRALGKTFGELHGNNISHRTLFSNYFGLKNPQIQVAKSDLGDYSVILTADAGAEQASKSDQLDNEVGQVKRLLGAQFSILKDFYNKHQDRRDSLIAKHAKQFDEAYYQARVLACLKRLTKNKAASRIIAESFYKIFSSHFKFMLNPTSSEHDVYAIELQKTEGLDQEINLIGQLKQTKKAGVWKVPPMIGTPVFVATIKEGEVDIEIKQLPPQLINTGFIQAVAQEIFEELPQGTRVGVARENVEFISVAPSYFLKLDQEGKKDIYVDRSFQSIVMPTIDLDNSSNPVANRAMNVGERRGGIDFTSDKALHVQNGGKEIKFDVSPAMMAQLQGAAGFKAVILGVEQLTNLREFLEIP